MNGTTIVSKAILTTTASTGMTRNDYLLEKKAGTKDRRQPMTVHRLDAAPHAASVTPM